MPKLVTFVKEIGKENEWWQALVWRKKTGNKNLFLGIWLLNKIFFWRSSDLFWPPKKSLQKNRLKKLPKLVTFVKENGKKLDQTTKNDVWRDVHLLKTTDGALQPFSPLFAELIRRSSFDLFNTIYLNLISEKSFMGRHFVYGPWFFWQNKILLWNLKKHSTGCPPPGGFTRLRGPSW